MSVAVVRSGEHHCGAGRDLEVEFIKYSFIFVHFTKLRVQVLSHVEILNRMLVVPYVPNLNSQVITAENIVVSSWGILSSRHGIDNFCKEMFAGRILLNLKY